MKYKNLLFSLLIISINTFATPTDEQIMAMPQVIDPVTKAGDCINTAIDRIKPLRYNIKNVSKIAKDCAKTEMNAYNALIEVGVSKEIAADNVASLVQGILADRVSRK